MDRLNYEQMRQTDIRTVNADSLVDIDEVVIDQALPREERLNDFIEKIKNPFCYKCNGMVVKAVYSEDGEKLEEKLVNLFMAMSGIM